MVLIIAFTDEGERTVCVDVMPPTMPLGIVRCGAETYANFPTRPTAAVQTPLDATTVRAAHNAARFRPHANRPTGPDPDQMPDTVVFPPELEGAIAEHRTFDWQRHRALHSDRQQLGSDDFSDAWFVARFKQPATQANIRDTGKAIATAHDQGKRTLAAYSTMFHTFYSTHIVCASRTHLGEEKVPLPLQADAPTRLRCTSDIPPFRRGDVLTTGQGLTAAGWPGAGVGARHRLLAPASKVAVIVQVTDKHGLAAWVDDCRLGPSRDTSLRVGLFEMVWWLFGPLVCTAGTACVNTTMAALLSTGLGRDLVASRTIGHGGVGTLAKGGSITFAEADLLQIGRACFVKRWSQLIPNRVAELRPQVLSTSATIAHHGTPPCMVPAALCVLPNLTLGFRRDISATYTAIALARGVPLADVLPPGLMRDLEARFAKNSFADLEASFAGDMAKGVLAKTTRCCNRGGSTTRVPCQMTSVHACAAIMGRDDVDDVTLLTPASMAAGNAAAPAARVETRSYDIQVVHGTQSSLVARNGIRGWTMPSH